MSITSTVIPVSQSGNGSTIVQEVTTEQERNFLEMVKKHLMECRRKKMSGKLSFEADMRDGGIMDRWMTLRVRER